MSRCGGEAFSSAPVKEGETMKKITSILCLLALTVGLLAGCGSTSGTATTAETTAAPAA